MAGVSQGGGGVDHSVNGSIRVCHDRGEIFMLAYVNGADLAKEFTSSEATVG